MIRKTYLLEIQIDGIKLLEEIGEMKELKFYSPTEINLDTLKIGKWLGEKMTSS